MNHYHNTNKESGSTLAASEQKAMSQEEKVLQFFLAFGDSWHFTPDAVLRYGDFPNTPITSIRRAMTNLEKRGKLMKTDNMEIGSYGKRVHTWMLKEANETPKPLPKATDGVFPLMKNNNTHDKNP